MSGCSETVRRHTAEQTVLFILGILCVIWVFQVLKEPLIIKSWDKTGLSAFVWQQTTGVLLQFREMYFKQSPSTVKTAWIWTHYYFSFGGNTFTFLKSFHICLTKFRQSQSGDFALTPAESAKFSSNNIFTEMWSIGWYVLPPWGFVLLLKSRGGVVVGRSTIGTTR